MRHHRSCALLLGIALAAGSAMGCRHAGVQGRPLHCMERFTMREFPIGTWGFPPSYVAGKPFFDEEYCRDYKASGFNTIIHAFPWWDKAHCTMISFDEPMSLAEKTGLKVIIHTSALTTETWGRVDVPVEKYGRPGPLHYVRLPELKWLHERHGSSPALVGYLLNDNCGLHDYSIECAQWLLENAPGLFPYMSTNPDPVGQSRAPMPIVSSQNYPYLYNPDGEEKGLRKALCDTLERDRAHANRYDMAMWPIITLGNTPSQIRFQVGSCLAYGAQAVWHFAYGPQHWDRKPAHEALQQANRYASTVAGPRVLGHRSIGVFHTGEDIANDALRPGPGQLIEAMDEQALVGVLVPEERFAARDDTPDYLVVVDKRTAKFAERKELDECLKAMSEGKKAPASFSQLLGKMRSEDPGPRPVRIQFGPRVKKVKAILPDGTTRPLRLGHDGAVETPPLRGGEGLLLKALVKPSERAPGAPAASVWKAPAVWRFVFDEKGIGEGEKWFAASHDDAGWKEIRIDVDGGWTKQGYGDAGTGWYRKELAIPAKLKGKHLYMHVGAVDEEAWVYIDGDLVFDHSAAATGRGIGELWVEPFSFEVTDRLKPGRTHTVCVRARNHYAAGGIYLPIHLVASERPLDKDAIWDLVRKDMGAD